MSNFDLATVRWIRDEIQEFGAETIIEGDTSTEENKLIDKFAEGTVSGYNDAVKQIVEFLNDLLK